VNLAKRNMIGLGAAILSGLIFLPALSTGAIGQDHYPSRPITLIVPYPAGGFVDVAARSLAEGLREKLGQPVVVMNKPGANGKVGLFEMVRSAPDGYTLLINNDGGIGIPPAVDPQFPFVADKDYIPIVQFADGKYLVTIRGSLPVTTIAELIAYARANPDKVNFGSPGIATSPHMAMEMLMQQTNTKMIHVPYPGMAPAMADLLKGVIDVLVNAVPGVRAYFDSKAVRILAVIDKKRLDILPNVPTIEESGVKSVAVNGWVGLFGQAGLPRPVLEKLNAAIKATLEDPTFSSRIVALGAEPSFKGLDEFPEFYRSEIGKWKKFSDETGIRIGK